MPKKRIILTSVIMFILIMIIAPSFISRINHEKDNNDVTVAINYNNANMILSKEEFRKSLDEFKNIGVNTVIIGEESVNSLIYSGYITGIRYNVLLHKYDDESEEIIKLISNDDKIHNDSYVLITKRKECKEYLARWIPSKYSQDEYKMKTTPLGADVYVLYNEDSSPGQITVGFDEKKIENAVNNGFDVALCLMAGDYKETKYVDDINSVVKKYNIKYINIKDNSSRQKTTPEAKKNVKKLCNLIKDNSMTLIVTENDDQLSNQKPMGYDELIKSADGRVIRSYETTDNSKSDKTQYEQRYYQMLNSVIDRNIRFVSVLQLTNGNDDFYEKNEKTVKSTKMLIEKLNKFGFDTDKRDSTFKDYTGARKIVYAATMLLMILMWIIIIEMAFGKTYKFLETLGIIGAILSIGLTFVVPQSILCLYPTLFAVTAPCFCITIVFLTAFNKYKKWSLFRLTVEGCALAFVSLLVCGMIQAGLLSGQDYVINTLIFRGIKLSLIVPILYGAVLYGVLLCRSKHDVVIKKLFSVLKADIKVYWILVVSFIGLIGLIYIKRSGNVSSISGTESLLRNIITDTMKARPRTKEFIVGWPCLVLFFYYLKNTNYKIVQWFLAMGSSILFASVINSFCHVFTMTNIIFMRVINGMAIGIFISVIAFILNKIALEIFNLFLKAGKEKWSIF